MNQNIEKLQKDLFAVKMEYVKNGYVRDIRILPGEESTLGQIILSTNGKILLDKDSKLYPALKELFPEAMTLSSAELQKIIDEGQGQILTGLDDLWFNIVGFELKRRELKKQSHSMINKIKKLWKGR